MSYRKCLKVWHKCSHQQGRSRSVCCFYLLFGCPMGNFGPLSRKPHSPDVNQCVFSMFGPKVLENFLTKLDPQTGRTPSGVWTKNKPPSPNGKSFKREIPTFTYSKWMPLKHFTCFCEFVTFSAKKNMPAQFLLFKLHFPAFNFRLGFRRCNFPMLVLLLCSQKAYVPEMYKDSDTEM